MKNYIIKTALAALCVLAAVSCSKDEPAHRVDVYSFLVNVPQDSWAYSGLDNNNYFIAEIDAPEITESVFDYGAVKVYRTFDYDKKDARQVELPYVLPKEVFVEYTEPAENGDLGYWAFFTETVTCEVGIGKIFIIYTASDFDYEMQKYPMDFPPEAMQFRCTIVY